MNPYYQRAATYQVALADLDPDRDGNPGRAGRPPGSPSPRPATTTGT